MSIRTNSTGWTRDVRLALPSLSDNTADADRVIGELMTWERPGWLFE
ncbi:MAG: hypothetical protein JRF25_14580 [Deltaproteobacteria bacterium]|nr:hypothetical protein [Deltaproteobacteria bacterium]